MARFARASDNEPLMKLERPTTASSQTTAHLINSCFSEVLSAKPHDAETVNNLAISRRGESDYHDGFVDRLKQVSDKYTHRLTLLSQLERHLVQARAKALADDEKALTSLTETCPKYDDLDLPRGPSQFRKHLDEELLARHHLLVPSQYLPSQPKHHKPPQDHPPSYLKPTHTATQHAHKPSNVDTSNLPTKQVNRPVWQNTLSPIEREAEKDGLTKFNQKANYLRNPRYSKSKWSNTASSGPVGLLQKESKNTEKIDSASFVAEPEVVQFTDYKIGVTYEATFVLKNVSGASRQLRLVPLSSPYFKVTPSHCPTNDCLVAPGLSSSFIVTFIPDSLANYQHEIKFVTCNNEDIVIPLEGFRPPPMLNLPAVLEVGYCLAGSKKECTLDCVNSGGEGHFRLGKLEDEDKTDECPSSLVIGSFTLSPRQFHLAAEEGRVALNVTFEPDGGVREYREEFSMACDNGQVITFDIRGIAQKVDVGCVFADGTIHNTHLLSNDEDDHFMADNEPHPNREIVITPSLNFDPVNPRNQSTGTVVIKNFSNVELPYHWVFYRPITEPPLWKRTHDKDTPLINKLILSDHTPFSVDPTSGTLLARETKSFTFKFNPSEVGYFLDVAHFVLTGLDSDEGLELSQENTTWLRLSQTEVAIVCVEMTAEAKDYSVEIYPPALLLPHKLPIATENKKLIKLTNNSLSSVCYQWDKFDCETVTITMDPPHGHIVPGGCIECDVIIQSKRQGQFSTKLACCLENCDKYLPLQISGQVETMGVELRVTILAKDLNRETPLSRNEGPVVTISCPCLDFGLVPVGRSGSLSFKVTSLSNCALDYTVRQLVQGHREGFIDVPCLSFSPSQGELTPNGSAVVSVDCISAGTTGRLKTIIQLLINGEPIKYFWALADLQCPLVSIDPCYIHMEKCYVGIEATHQLTLTNRSPVPTQFTWSSCVGGVGGEGVRVCVSPMTGRIGANETVVISVQAIWNKMGSHSEAILCCDVIDMSLPLFVCLSAQVYGLTISYNTSTSPLRLDLGSFNKLGAPVSETVIVTNTSSIPATLEATVTHFPSATPPAPPTQPKPDDGVSLTRVSRGRALLNRTANLGDKNSKSSKQAISDFSGALLRDGRGSCFVVDPPSTHLPPFTPVTLTLTAHSDMWGKYTDQLICKVPGDSDTVIPVKYGAIGCPIIFQSTASVGHTLARLGSHAPGAKPVKRTLKLKNTSPVAIRIDWEMFNLLQNDNKYVDLLMSIGDPFPEAPGLLKQCHQPTQSTLSKTVFSQTDSNLATRSESCLLQSEKSVLINDDLISLSESRLDDSIFDSETFHDNRLITTLIKPHEGVRSTHPFDIHPKQLVITGRGSSSVEITFSPTQDALKEMGHSLASFALGYFSLDGESPPNVRRKSGHDVEPLRIDILADIEHARLSLQCDEDDGLTFTYPASVLLEKGSPMPLKEKSLTHHFTLVNPTSSVAVFYLSTLSQHFTLSNIMVKNDQRIANSHITLKPQRSVGFDVSFSVRLGDVREAASEASYTITDSLQISFSTGAVQTFPLSSVISLPRLSLSIRDVDFGIAHINSKPVITTVLLSNTSTSHAVWRLEVSSDLQDVLSVQPDSGVLALHMDGGKPSTELIRLEFAPSRESSYSGFIHLTEDTTCEEITIKVTGQGSADEKFVVMY